MAVSLSDFPWFPSELLLNPACNSAENSTFGAAKSEQFLVPGEWGFYSKSTPWYKNTKLTKDTILPVIWLDPFNQNNASTTLQNVGSATFTLKSSDSLNVRELFSFTYTHEDLWYPGRSNQENFFTIADECNNNITTIGLPFSLFFRPITSQHSHIGRGQYDFQITWELAGGSSAEGGRTHITGWGITYLDGEGWVDSFDQVAPTSSATETSGLKPTTGVDGTGTVSASSDIITITAPGSTITVVPTDTGAPSLGTHHSIPTLWVVVLSSLLAIKRLLS